MKPLTKAGEFAIFRLGEKPFEDVSIIHGISENISGDSTRVIKSFRWSRDGFEFSDFMSYDINTINSLGLVSYKKFWIDVKYELDSDATTEVLIDNIQFNAEYKISKTDYPFNIAYSIERDSRFFPVEHKSFTYDPYNQTGAVRLQKELSYMMNNIFGVECLYIKADATLESRDPILMEWGLLNYRSPITFKLMIPDNEIPENKLNFTPYGVDFEIPFEVHIDKRYFEFIFGISNSPQKFDVIYIPISDRMYEIESSQLHRDFMNEPVYFKINLKKAQRQSHIEMTKNTEELIKEKTVSIEDLFGDEIRAEQNKVTKPLQLKDRSEYSINARTLNYSSDLFVKKEDIYNNNVLISKNYYDFKSIYDVSQQSTVVKYNTPNKAIPNNRTLTCWYRETEIPKEQLKRINEINIDSKKMFISYLALPNNCSIGSTLVLKDRISKEIIFYGTVEDINKDTNIITVTNISDVYQYSSDNYGNWVNNVSNLLTIITSKKNILSNSNKDAFDVNIIVPGLLELWLGGYYYRYKLNKSDNNQWYSLLIQASSKFKQLGIYQYGINSTTKKIDLLTKINDELPQDIIYDFIYTISASPLQLTNIRLFVKNINEEYHTRILSQNIVSDAQNAIIIDNADVEYDAPFVGNIK